MDSKKIIRGFLKDSVEIARRISMVKKVQVTFSDEQLKLIKRLRGTMGFSDSDVVRNIVIFYLSEKSYIKEEISNKMKSESG